MKNHYLLIIISFLSFSTLFSQLPEQLILQDTTANFPATCGLSTKYLKKLRLNSEDYAPKTYPLDFPAYAIINCGKFDIYYEDLILSNPQVGFSDATTGIARRNTLCAVLTYVQSVFDFSNIPAGNPIRLHVNESLAPVVNPAPIGGSTLAFAGPTFSNLGPPQIVNGNVHLYTTTGIDPVTANQYHAELTVNFDQIAGWAGPIQWHNDHTIPIINCHYDLYSVLLHEIGHTLGWLSLIEHSGPTEGEGTPVSAFGNNQFSGIDALLHVGDNSYPLALIPLVLGAPSSPSINPAFASSTTVLTDNKVWINDQPAPNNDPVYSGFIVGFTGYPYSIASLLSHLDDQIWCYSRRSRISPGETKNYVMAPFMPKGILKRTFEDIEINTLLDLDFELNASYSSLTLENSPPYSTRMASYTNYLNNTFPETVVADFPILTNDTGATIVIDLSTDPTLVDLENDPIFVSPGSLVNYRGCGNGGNNHNALSITSTAQGDIITYTPRSNFYGRAQFGFRLWDGKEEGSYVIYTIDVEKGNNVNCAVGSNIILNGDFEEGSEVRRLGSEEVINASVLEQDNYREGKLRTGIHFGDCHPYNYLSNNWMPFGAGDLIKDSRFLCNGTVYKSWTGSNNVSFPGVGGSAPNPNSAYGVGQRYRNIFGMFNYFNLCTDVETCKRYVLEFDYFAKPFSIPTGAIIPLTIAFSNDATHPTLPAYTFSTVQNITVTNNAWTNVSIPVNYCGDSPASILSLIQTTFSQGFLIDNLVLREDLTPLPLTLAITPESAEICAGNSIALSTVVDNAMCNITYNWIPATGLSCIDCPNPVANPTATIEYTLTVGDGCFLTSEQVTVIVDNSLDALSASASPSIICSAGTSVLTATGAESYTWNPGNSSGSSVSVSPAVTTTYTVTGTSSNGCVASTDITVTVDNSLEALSASASPSIICSGETSVLIASGAESYTWNPGNSSGSSVSVSPAVTTTYTVTGTSSNGCVASTDIIVTVDNSLEALSASASPSFICSGGTSVLTALGAESYTWNPGNINGNSISVNPIETTTYAVTGTSINGCTDEFNVTVNVENIPATISIAATFLEVCEGGSTTLTASGAESYTWNPDNISGSSIVVNPTVTTTYTVTGTTTAGCVGTNEVTITVTTNDNPFCCTDPNFIFSDDENSFNVGSIPDGSVINIYGTFNVNTNFTLVSCTLRMAPNARIEVLSGFNFDLTDCLIFSCTEMWDGIYSNPGAMVSITGSRIEDAKFAVSSVSGGNYFLDNTVFNKNNISVYVGLFSSPHPGIVKNCTFDCTSLNSPTSGSVLKAPFAGDKTHFGIHCQFNNNITFGEISALPNVFQNIEIGIYSIGSNVAIYRNNFNNIIEPFCSLATPGGCPVVGWAIWGIRSHLLIGDNAGLSHENNINDCSNGIFLDGFCSYEIRKNSFTNIVKPLSKNPSKCIYGRFSSLGSALSYGEIEDNVFVNFQWGIYYEANQMNYIHIERNRFSGFNTPNGTAIFMRQNQPHQIEIRNNVINNLPIHRGWYGIRVQNAVQPGGMVIIEKNTIKNVRHGIWLTNYFNGVRILNNSDDYYSIGTTQAGIYYPNSTPPAFSVGIKVENCPRTLVLNNLVQKQNPNPTTTYTNMLYGISIETNGISSVIQENEVRRLGKGLNFYGQPNAPLRVTCNGMYANRVGLSLNNTFIGDQGLPNPGGIAQDNQWSIPGNVSNGWKGAERISSPLTTWYTRSSTLPFFPNQISQMEPSFAIVNSTNYLVSGASYNCTFGCPNPPCLPVEIVKMVRKEAPFDQINNEERKMVDIQLYRELKTQPEYLNTGNTTDTLFANYLDSLESTNIARIYRFNEKLELGDTLGAYTEVMNITPEYTPEDNHKIVNEIYWRTWVYNIFEFSSADSSALYQVAEQKPHLGGTAVYDARVMLGLDFFDFVEDENKMSENYVQDQTNSDSKDQIEFVLYPNPASTFISYMISLEDSETATFTIYDVVGREIYRSVFDNENKSGSINISEMAKGSYTYKVELNNKLAKSGSFIIN